MSSSAASPPCRRFGLLACLPAFLFPHGPRGVLMGAMLPGSHADHADHAEVTARALQVDPLDRRRLVLCGSKGSFIVLWCARVTI